MTTIREELSNRSVPKARHLREEIDPSFSIDRPKNSCVYVIELSEEVRNKQTFARKNPNARTDRPCLYVGCTAKTREERFKEHREGERSSTWVRDYGVRIRLEFTLGLDDLVWEEANRREEQLTDLLRDEGYGIWQA